MFVIRLYLKSSREVIKLGGGVRFLCASSKSNEIIKEIC